jgi:hypothetical protein
MVIRRIEWVNVEVSAVIRQVGSDPFLKLFAASLDCAVMPTRKCKPLHMCRPSL